MFNKWYLVRCYFKDGQMKLDPSAFGAPESVFCRNMYQSMCSSQLKARKRKQVSDTSASASLETSHNDLMFPKLTLSPLRRFQLIDSDSDEPPGCDNVSKEVREIGPSSIEQRCNPDHSATLSEQKRKVSANMNQNED